jgi:hypothetical protein
MQCKPLFQTNSSSANFYITGIVKLFDLHSAQRLKEECSWLSVDGDLVIYKEEGWAIMDSNLTEGFDQKRVIAHMSSLGLSFPDDYKIIHIDSRIECD